MGIKSWKKKKIRSSLEYMEHIVLLKQAYYCTSPFLQSYLGRRSDSQCRSILSQRYPISKLHPISKLRPISKLHLILNWPDVVRLVHVSVLSRFDYCSEILLPHQDSCQDSPQNNPVFSRILMRDEGVFPPPLYWLFCIISCRMCVTGEWRWRKRTWL